jgi:S1-C subfamily serine protease
MGPRLSAVSSGTVNLNAKMVPGSSTAPAEQPGIKTAKPQVISTTANGSETEVQHSSGKKDGSGWIGVATQQGPSGVVVTAVFSDSPAAKAGLQIGDIIQKVNGQPLKDEDFDSQMRAYKPGTNIVVNFMRGAWASVKLVTVGQGPL